MASDRRDKRRREAGGHIGELFDDDSAIDEFFSPRRTRPPGAAVPPTVPKTPPKRRPTHYKVISISLYTEDIERLQTLVDELKRRGHTRANKSLLIREALRQLDLDAIPPQR